MIEVETQTIEVEVVTNAEVTSTGQVEVETVDLSDLDITVAKKEYVITGDDIYIPMLYDDAPQWMKNLVQVVVDVSISSGNQSLINDMNAIIQDFAVSYVPLNQYTQSIIDLSDEDTRLNGLIEALNSNFNDGLSTANAQIISLQLTKASKDEVVAQVIQTIAAQLADGASNIGSTIGRIDQAIADETSARALSLQTLTASLEDTNLDVTANAEVIQNALAYVGIDEAGASTGTGLSAYLEDSNGNIGGADSELANSIRVTAEGVESKFAYNSLLNINGIYKKSGFGLTTNYVSGSGTQVDPYVSEFWIDASRLKFTNSNQTGQVAPFTIDATGVTPQITFNGKVQFSNVTGYTPPDVSGSINANNDVFAQKLGYVDYQAMIAAALSGHTIINGGYVNTSLIQANSINANMINTTGLIAENISADEIVGKTITGSTLIGAVIQGAVIKASYLDLDGELEVLTNYHITVAMYNANPSLYTDAVYIEGNDEYRIPSISTVREDTVKYHITSATTKYGILSSYNTANVGNNNKAVKINPSFLCTSEFLLIDSVCSIIGIETGTCNHFILSLNGVNLLTYIVKCANSMVYIQISGEYFTTKSYSYYIKNGILNNYSYVVDIGFAKINLLLTTEENVSLNGDIYTIPTLSATVLTGEKVLPFNWTSGKITFEQVTAARSSSYAGAITGSTDFNLNQSLQINNMI